MLRRLAALLAVLALTASPAAASSAPSPDSSPVAPLADTLTPPVHTSTSAYLGKHLSWTTFDQLSGDGTGGPNWATTVRGVAGGAGLIVETGADTIASSAASWTSADGGVSWTEHIQAGPRSFGPVVAHGGTYVTWAPDGLYSSTDGSVWTRAVTGPHAINRLELAAGPQGFIVFVRNGTSTITRVWRSSTGASGTWTADRVQGPVSTFCPQSVVVTSSRIVASGTDCSALRTPRILVNATGRTWVRGTVPTGLRTAGTYTRSTSVSYAASRYLLTGANSTQSATWVWSSTNGLTWKHIATVPRSASWSVDAISRIYRLAPGWVAIGSRDMPADDGRVVVWSSTDLVHWARSVPTLVSSCDVTVQMVSQAAVLSGRLMAVGTAWGMTADCGETWMATVTP